MGLHVMLRHGSIRSDLPTLAALLRDHPIDTSRVMLTLTSCTRGTSLQKGYMDYVVRVAIELGIPPIKAYQMATINPARYFHLDGEMGGLSPGKVADLLVLRDYSRTDSLEGSWSTAGGFPRGDTFLIELKRPAFPFSTKASLDVKWISEDHLKVRSNALSTQEVPPIIFQDKTHHQTRKGFLFPSRTDSLCRTPTG